MELFDVIDSKGNPTGQIVSREKAHAERIMVCAPSSRQLKKYSFFATQIMLGSIFMLP